MATTLAAMLGQIGLPGSGIGFGYACESGMGTPREWIAVPSVPSGENLTRSSIPVARISDMLLSPGASYHYRGQERQYPDIRMVYWCGGNPFHHHQDLNRLMRAWQRPETIIVHEPWWTATARHADIILPATTPWERMDLAYSSRDRFILAMDQLIAPLGEARDDHAIFSALAQRFGFLDALPSAGAPRNGCVISMIEYRDNARRKQVSHALFRGVLGKGLRRDSGTGSALRTVRRFPSLARALPAPDAVRPDRDLLADDRRLWL
ncbi:MAG: molybdopterin-dependent oxidoreductase [Pseudomonadota bacterium]